MKHHTQMLLLACLAASIPQTTLAQRPGSLELGFDVGVDLGLSKQGRVPGAFPADFGGPPLRYEEHTITADAPVAVFRMGFFLNDRVQIQPMFGFAFLYQGSEIERSTADVGLVANISLRPQSSLSPFLQIGFLGRFRHEESFAHLVTRSTTELGVPIQVGLRLPVSDDLAIRMQTGAIYWFGQGGSETFEQESWSIPIQVGLSFFAM